jgi:hypothetical protein
MLLIDGESQLESSKSNLFELLTLVLFRSHRGSAARQPPTGLPKCKFSDPPLHKRIACKSWIILSTKNYEQTTLLFILMEIALNSGKLFLLL